MYYIEFPEKQVSAIVDAPSTDKARTAFLDTLERKGIIYRGIRGQVRSSLVVDNIDSIEGINPTYIINYSYGDSIDSVPVEQAGLDIEKSSEPIELQQPQQQQRELTPLEKVTLGVQ